MKVYTVLLLATAVVWAVNAARTGNRLAWVAAAFFAAAGLLSLAGSWG